MKWIGLNLIALGLGLIIGQLRKHDWLLFVASALIVVGVLWMLAFGLTN